MNLVINEVPQPRPPATYDLIGLSEEEMAVIYALIGALTSAAERAIIAAAGHRNVDAGDNLFNSFREYGKKVQGKDLPRQVAVLTNEHFQELMERYRK